MTQQTRSQLKDLGLILAVLMALGAPSCANIVSFDARLTALETKMDKVICILVPDSLECKK